MHDNSLSVYPVQIRCIGLRHGGMTAYLAKCGIGAGEIATLRGLWVE